MSSKNAEYYQDLLGFIDEALFVSAVIETQYFYKDPDGQIKPLLQNKHVATNGKQGFILRSQCSSDEEFEQKKEQLKIANKNLQWQTNRTPNPMTKYIQKILTLHEKLIGIQQTLQKEHQYIYTEMPTLDKNKQEYKIQRHKISSMVIEIFSILGRIEQLVEFCSEEQKKQIQKSKKPRIDNKKIQFFKKVLNKDPSLKTSTNATIQAALEAAGWKRKLKTRVPSEPTIARYRKQLENN